MSEVHTYAVLQLGEVVNLVAATEEVAAENGWVRVPDGVAPHKRWTYQDGEFVISPEDLAIKKAGFIDQARILFSESQAHVQPDLWDGYTTEQKQAWTDYRAALRNVANVVNAEGWDHETYELPVITQV